MPDYSLGKIYCIRSHQTDKIYIGSTCQDYLSRRFQEHKRISNTTTTSRIIIDYGDAYIELLENFPCATKQELHKREGELIRINKEICINIRIEGRSKKQYREENKEKIEKRNRQISEENKEKIKERNKQCREKEKIKENVKQFYLRYYKDNKEKIPIQMRIF